MYEIVNCSQNMYYFKSIVGVAEKFIPLWGTGSVGVICAVGNINDTEIRKNVLKLQEKHNSIVVINEFFTKNIFSSDGSVSIIHPKIELSGFIGSLLKEMLSHGEALPYCPHIPLEKVMVKTIYRYITTGHVDDLEHLHKTALCKYVSAIKRKLMMAKGIKNHPTLIRYVLFYSNCH